MARMRGLTDRDWMGPGGSYGGRSARWRMAAARSVMRSVPEAARDRLGVLVSQAKAGGARGWHG